MWSAEALALTLEEMLVAIVVAVGEGGGDGCCTVEVVEGIELE
jgi:hypothetical protein